MRLPLASRTPLPVLNLVHQKARAAVSIAGVGFAMVLIFMQLGFHGAVENTAGIVYDELEFDLVIRSPEYLQLYEADTIDRRWLDWAASEPNVISASPFYVLLHTWLASTSADIQPIAVLAQNPEDFVLRTPAIRQQLSVLRRADALLIDQATRKDFGPINNEKFAVKDLDRWVEVGNAKFQIAGLFYMGTGLAANGAVVTSDIGISRIAPWDARQKASLGLIRLKSGSDVLQFAKQLKSRLNTEFGPSPPIEILTREEVIARERHRWVWETPIGVIFQMGVALAFLVGAAIVYMVLSTDVAARLPEYATLKAMGYTNGFLAGIVMQQAWILALVGFVPAVLISLILYYFTSYLANLTITMTWGRLGLVLILGLLMCSISGWGAVRKLVRAEPASLF